jgi:RNA polymerase sigma-70 factor (ECF subfamily)
MLLNAARLPARTDIDGNLLRLKEQDRALWSQAVIGCGMAHLARSAEGESLSAFHLQAGIAACHCTAPEYAATDWPRILALYDRLVEIDDSPVVALNRAVAVANVHGPRAGIDAVQGICNRRELDAYYLLFSVLGDFEAQLGNAGTAAGYFRRAVALTNVRSEQAFLSRRLQECEARTTSAEARR